MNFFSSFDSKRPRVSSLESGSCEGEEAGEGDSEKGGTEAGEETASTEGEVIKEDKEKKGDEEVKVGEGKEGGEEGKGREEGKGGREWGVGGEELEDEGAGSEFQDLLGGGLVGEGRGRRRMRVHTVETLESCVHEVAVPPSLDYTPLFKPATKPAKQYSFILDPFQKEAILCIDNNQSVLVSAHTSAGKTVVAEYSIAVSLNMKQRVIYTTPIKALSNQKYREFCEQFEDVGLVTGDVTINPTASCLIMTTEILRNLLYHGSEILREVSWVIFDEIHYMRDKERGVVWEETLILLPHNVRFVFLSATIPNAREFAEWVAFLHDQPCHVVYTDFRPTPLQHYIFPVCGEGIHLVVDEAGQFLDKNFETAMKVLEGKPLAPAKGKGDVNCFKLIKMVMERNLAPAIVFSFSKKECEMYALQVAKMDFNTPEQKSCVDEIFKNAMIVLSDEDRALPQVENVLPLLRRGIGIHHGGLLPILKETIELLFAEGLIKALFATETFAMGLNMPARTVVFTGLRKFDGQEHRIITSGEYIQMSGRAGRRGLDEKGIVIVMMDEAVKPSVGKELVQGKADFLNSAFHLTYSMILNLMRVEGINPEYILERSFFQFQNRAKLPLFLDEYERLKKEISEIQIEDEKTMTKYYDIKTELEGKKEEMRRYVYQPFYAAPFLQPGRLVKMTGMEGEKYDWGVVLGHHGGKGRGSMKPDDGSDLTIDVIVAKAESQPRVQYRSPKYGWTVTLREVEVVSLPAANLVEISVLRIEQPKDMRKKEQRLRISKSLEEISKRFPEGIPVLDPRIDLKVDDSKLSAFEAEVRKYERKLEGVVEGKGPCDPKQFELYSKKRELRKEKEAVADRIKEAVSLIHMDELKRRKRVLRRLEYCTEKDVILMKGRVACELSSVDELVMTELLFSGVLNDLSPNEVTALLTVFVCDERSNETPKIPENLQMPLRKLKEITDRVLKTSVDAMLDLNEELYTSQFKPYLIQVVLSWTTGISFAEICKMTDFFEGSIIRCLRRLEELLRQLVQVAKKVGNVVLEAKFSTGITLIKRDIVFAASLYL